MQRYWLFAGSNFYPNGGMSDFVISMDDLEDVKSYIKIMKTFQWAHIYDSLLHKIILEIHDVSEDMYSSTYEWRPYDRESNV